MRQKVKNLARSSLYDKIQIKNQTEALNMQHTLTSGSIYKQNNHLLVKDLTNDEILMEDTHNTSIFSSKVASLPSKNPMRSIHSG